RQPSTAPATSLKSGWTCGSPAANRARWNSRSRNWPGAFWTPRNTTSRFRSWTKRSSPTTSRCRCRGVDAEVWMIDIVDWARDLLVSRGALVETEEAGALLALLPAELAAALESREWLSLRFGGGAGASDENEWLDRLSRLLPPDARVVSARLRRPVLVPPVDAAGA